MRTVSTKGWLLLAASAALGVTLALARCFSPQLPTCAYICNKTEPRCPDEYECRADCYCHLKGSTEGCGFPQDLGCDAATPAPDLASTPKDLAMAPPDLAGTD
jgi:hypothetical protein